MIERFTVELFKFRSELESRGYSPQEIGEKLTQLHQDFDFLVGNVMADGLRSAVGAAADKGATKFIEDLKPSDDSFRIETMSGKTDFSTPPFDMKEFLLKDAPISKDGSRYKVIPIAAKAPRQLKLKMSSMEVDRLTAVNLREEYEAHLAAMGKKMEWKKKGLKPDFRTVTDKSTGDSWTQPGTDKDMTQELDNINDNINARLRTGLIDLMAYHLQQQEFRWDS